MTAEAGFWKWFVDHEAELFDFDPNQELERKDLFDRLALELHKSNRDLTFEFGPKGAPREFVISAAGMKNAFPAVIRLTRAAPKLERWRVMAFRPRRTPINIVEIEGKRID